MISCYIWFLWVLSNWVWVGPWDGKCVVWVSWGDAGLIFWRYWVLWVSWGDAGLIFGGIECFWVLNGWSGGIHWWFWGELLW